MHNKLNRTAVWCGALALVIILDQWKHLFPGQYTLLAGAEPIRQAYSWFTFWRRSILDGSWPLWDPNSWGGYAFPGEMQTAAFYPPYFVLLLFHPNRFGLVPVPLYTALFLSAHVVAALAMFALMRHLRTSRLAAFVAGFAFSSGSFTGAVTWPHMLQSAIWLPLIALYLFRALEAETRIVRVRNSLLSGLFLGLSLLAGGLHIAMAQGVFVVSATAYYALTREKRAWSAASLRGALVLLSALGVAAVQLFPSHLYAEHTLRALGGIAHRSASKPPYTFLTHDALSPRAIMTFLFPTFEGIGTGEIWTPYVGVLPFLFAVLAVAKLWSRPWVAYLASLGGIVFLYSLAGMSAVHGVLYLVTPFLWMAREATRFIYLTGFCVCVLAGFGLDTFRSALMDYRQLKRLTLFTIGGCLFLFMAGVFFPKIGGYWEFFSVLLILMSAVLLYRASDKLQFRSGRVFPILVISPVFFDLNAYNWTGTNKLEGASASKEDIDILDSLQGAAHYLREQPSPFRVKVAYEPEPNIGDAYGVPGLSGGGVTIDQYAWRALPFSNLLNVAYLVRPASVTEPGALYQDKFWKVYRNAQAFPRGWIVHRIKVEAGEEEMYNDTKNGGADLRNVALVASAPDAPVTVTEDAAGDSVRVTSYAARRIQLSARASAPGLLVLSEIYYPEWHAIVNGREVKILRTDEALRAVPIPAGQSTVEFVYRPISVYVGAFVSLLSGMLIGAVWWWQPRT